MVGKFAKSAVALTLITASLAAAPAMAHGHKGYNGYDTYPVQYNNGYGDRYDRPNRNRDYDRGYRCKKSGTGGLIIGAVAGGLLGRAVVGKRGDRTAGVIVGAGAGALAGRALDRNGSNRC